ncbi:TetR/AcrR family transcriptional regulator [Amycolatopsis rhizosphaerae]|uniref:TetR/AcrR family transcriptional regulator n=1 Tax=Amycolatopsis rhizosphaerae TaxID=2053003 RepID=A0A558AI66_9PSEU|nr:TetR/AcrR family transcriptional regulator [Amycolatopsis rhizosphaerae]TVT23962.1 TetR/AcrR family transcriptional regulator [Amycolatopsis rhizosphaerae]
MRARERILDAATALMERSGFEAVNMLAVAREAEVSRQTVYAHFGSREDLISEAIIRISGQVFDRVNARLTTASDAAEHVVEFVVAVRSEFRQHPVLGALAFPDRGSPLFDDQLFARATPVAERFLAPIAAREPRLAARFDDVVEITLRFGLSILLFDSDAVRTDDDLRAFLRRSLLPALTL